MQRKINHDDFESFLQQSADQVRLQPSSAIWKNISKELNKKRRRWPAIVVMLLITVSTGGYFIWHELNINPPAHTEVSRPSKTITSSPLQDKLVTTNPAANQPVKKSSFKPLSLFSASPAIPLLSVQPLYSERALWIPENLTMAREEELPSLNRQARVVNETIALKGWNELTSSLLNNIPVTDFTTARSMKNPDSINAEKAEEVVANVKTKGRKLSWQIYISPNISYRKLSENKSFAWPTSSPAIALNFPGLYDVNNAVTHKPNVGVELGITAKYGIAKNVNLRTGFQFNVSRYNIRAFNYIPEVATISLNNGYRVDFVNTISSYRNFNGGKTNWLRNFYFQASVPVGAEVKLTGNNKMHVGVASTLQPTYIIGDRAYLITNDYKNYAELPWLIRRWNVNTSLETFVSYSAGKTKWQIGPQVRYQLLSSFISKYPVKENLFDFGLKVGVTLNQQ